MTQPATFTSGQRIITSAMQNAGLLGAGTDPSSEQFAQYTNRLNDLINFQQTQGLKLWTNEEVTVPLVNGVQTYPMSPAVGGVVITKPMRIISCYYVDTSQNQRPLLTLSWDDWEKLSSRTQTGQINSYFVDKQAYQINLSFWLIPDSVAATGSVVALTQRQINNITNIVTDQIDMPLEWIIGFGWMLADEICTGQPQSIMDRCMQRANMYRTMLEDWDVEDASTTFSPDSRVGQPGGFT